MFKLTETLAVTFVGGLLFTLLDVPLSWMLGPLTAALLWQGLTKRELKWPVGFRNGGLLLLGYSMGLSFTAESARQIAGQLPSMLLATLLTVGFSLGFAWLIARRTGITLQSSVIGSVPGGLSQMVVLSEEIKGADQTVVSFMQTIRLLTVIFVVPFLAVHGLADSAAPGTGVLPQPAAAAASGAPAWAVPVITALVIASALLAMRLRLPTPWFLGPIIVAAALTVTNSGAPHLPTPLVLAAQWSLGIYLGLGIRFSALVGWRRLLPYSLAGGIAVVVLSLTLSYGYSLVLPISMVTAFLSTSPGGMTEMGVTAAAIGGDVSMVVAYQMFRILFILFIVPYLLRLGFRRHLKQHG
ncbi:MULTISPECIES: AbrB family transcriptional regulator [unclassified Paenibacillus]|uniref:AbrB family transcriptional regulator n=1 Tax=unclassified Paenibacillus TaxID=185978 RepID=UPI001AE75E51|nr:MULTISPECIES: AbrB family transcriptional regulator [unclassified Paenibacillus]MBP1155033.1 membrane AbrB-like protein [Paenibacillus sp. PvP091]MBP1169584.1 membrane AbrB-like protein [Paenibacillus sp. PvR098]MBP2440612.1 membrane AbrB-like protein [Paenibacillus sp. PvP052]